MTAQLTTVKIKDKISLVTTLKFPSAAVAIVKPSYKRMIAPEDMVIIESAWDAYQIFQAIWNMDIIDYCEEMYALFLNGRHAVHAYARIAEGSVNQCEVYLQKILTLALITNSASFILAHNHPSGNVEASNPDKNFTKRAAQAAHLVGLKLLDHLILTSCPGGMTSIRDEFPSLFSEKLGSSM